MHTPSGHFRPGRIVVAYVIISSAWIAASDLLLRGLPNQTALSTLKGWLFVLVTGLLLYLLLFRASRALEGSEEETRITEYRFRKLVEAVPEGIYFRLGDTIEYANPAALKCFGAERADQVEGTPVLSRFPEQFHAFMQQKMNLLDEAEEAIPPVELQILRLDGTPVDIELAAVPLTQTSHGGSLVIFRDITDRKRAIDESRRLEEQFRQAQKMESLGRLAGGIAHDFNNYLTVINGYSELLLSSPPEGNHIRERIGQIRTAGERASALTRQLLTLSRRDSSELSLVDLNASVREVAGLSRRLLGEHIRLDLDLTADSCHILAGHGDIGQILMNLLVNARDAMPEGGAITIRTSRLTQVAHGATVPIGLLEIRDTGAGIEPELQRHVFEPFFTTKRPGQGTGLGLSTVYSIVHRCAGTVEVKSEVGQGTSFFIYLPLRPSPVQESAAGPAPESFSHGGETILVVEDHEDVRTYVAHTLQGSGYRVLTAASGREALQRAERQSDPIHLLLTDVVMPEMTGLELARRLRSIRPDLRVLFMSGYAGPFLTGEPSSHGALLHKPIHPETLTRRVADSLRKAPAGSAGVL
jgi:PAS domain S-box-containing protein